MRTDRHDMTKVIVIFRNSVNAPKKDHHFPEYLHNGCTTDCYAVVQTEIFMY